MRAFSHKSKGSDGWPGPCKAGRLAPQHFNHITAYFVVHFTHAASLPHVSSLNWLFLVGSSRPTCAPCLFKVKEQVYTRMVGLCPTTLPLNYTTHIKGKSFLKLYLITDASAMHRPFPPGRDHWVRSLGHFITPPVISSP